MARDRDDALSWDGDDDPTLAVGADPARNVGAHHAHDVEAGRALDVGAAPAGEPSRTSPPALPDGFTAVGRGQDAVGRLHADGTTTSPGERPPLGNAALIAFGVLGGVYLLYILGWVLGGQRLQGTAQYLVADVMFQGSFWLAVLAPALWFGTVLLLTRRARPWLRFVWLAVGALLLVPWPFIMVGAVGQ